MEGGDGGGGRWQLGPGVARAGRERAYVWSGCRVRLAGLERCGRPGKREVGAAGGGECEGSGGGDNGKEGWGRGREQWVGSGGRGQAGEGLQADVTGVGGGTEWEAPRWDGIVEESRMRDGGRGGERAWGGQVLGRWGPWRRGWRIGL